MENFFHGDKFHTDLGSLIDDISETEDLSDLPEDWETDCTESNYESVFVLDPHDIYNAFAEDRDGEDMDSHDEIISILKQHIDFEKINSLIPKMYYEKPRQKIIITKKDLLDYIS